MRTVIFRVAFWLTLPILQTGADLAALYRRAPAGLRPVVVFVWLPVRMLGLVSFRLCAWLVP